MKKVLLFLGCLPVLFFGVLVMGAFSVIASTTGASFSGGADPPPGNGPLFWPRPSLVVTSPFGRRQNATNGDAGEEMHWGLDLAGDMGEPVQAAHAGRVNLASWSGGYGNLVILVRADGLVTYYGHLSAFNVSRGDEVAAGDVIGFVGSTGRSTGPHLHFEVRPDGGNPVDPRSYLAPPN